MPVWWVLTVGVRMLVHTYNTIYICVSNHWHLVLIYGFRSLFAQLFFKAFTGFGLLCILLFQSIMCVIN